jgi:hypothetical protein
MRNCLERIFGIFPRRAVHAKYRRANSPDGTAAKYVDFSIVRGLARIRSDRKDKNHTCPKSLDPERNAVPYYY